MGGICNVTKGRESNQQHQSRRRKKEGSLKNSNFAGKKTVAAKGARVQRSDTIGY